MMAQDKTQPVNDPSARLGDVSIDVPAGGSATQGAAQGAGLSRDVANTDGPGGADPGGGNSLTDEAAPVAARRPSTASQSGLGDTASGGSLQDFDAAFEHRDRRS
jgi:hypothetical protein